MDIEKIKSQFKVFEYKPELVYTDNASTTQRPQCVVAAVEAFEQQGAANIHRGLYRLAEAATQKFEEARKKISDFIHASDPKCIAFTKGTTESINTVAFGFLKDQLQPGDEVLISAMEHHANLIPWQQVCKAKNARLKIIPINEQTELVPDTVANLITKTTRLLALTHISNTLGTINPATKIIEIAHQHNVPVLIDAAQSIVHYPVDVEKLNVDFMAFSAHKMFGPFGVGILYTHPKHHENMGPLTFGGGAVKDVTFDKTEWLEYPHSMEAGTPNVAGVVGLSAALDFLSTFDFTEVSNHVESLRKRFEEGLRNESGFKIIGEATKKSGIVSFVHERIHPHDIATFLASKNIAVRAGHHCTQPLLAHLGVKATVRASFTIYNSHKDVDHVLDALVALKKFWS